MTDFERDRRFGEFVSSWRKRFGLNRSDVAKKTGIPTRRILELEHGEGTGATRRECMKLAVVYGLDARAIENRAAGL